MCRRDERVCACGKVLEPVELTEKCYGMSRLQQKLSQICISVMESADSNFNVQKEVLDRLEPLDLDESLTLHIVDFVTTYLRTCTCEDTTAEQKAEFTRCPRHQHTKSVLVMELHASCGRNEEKDFLGHGLCVYGHCEDYNQENDELSCSVTLRHFSFIRNAACLNCHKRENPDAFSQRRETSPAAATDQDNLRSELEQKEFVPPHLIAAPLKPKPLFQLSDTPFYPDPVKQKEEEEMKRKKIKKPEPTPQGVLENPLKFDDLSWKRPEKDHQWDWDEDEEYPDMRYWKWKPARKVPLTRVKTHTGLRFKNLYL